MLHQRHLVPTLTMILKSVVSSCRNPHNNLREGVMSMDASTHITRRSTEMNMASQARVIPLTRKTNCPTYEQLLLPKYKFIYENFSGRGLTKKELQLLCENQENLEYHSYYSIEKLVELLSQKYVWLSFRDRLEVCETLRRVVPRDKVYVQAYERLLILV